VPYLIGLVVSAGVAVFARQVGLDRDRAFYPTVMIVIALYYVWFAVMSGSVQTVVVESVVMTLFAAAAVAGFKSNAWIVVEAGPVEITKPRLEARGVGARADGAGASAAPARLPTGPPRERSEVNGGYCSRSVGQFTITCSGGPGCGPSGASIRNRFPSGATCQMSLSLV
jgi:hypothetical protein